jgi:hypothetical protein
MHKFASRLGIFLTLDKSVAIAVLGSLRAILFGPIIIYLISKYFSPTTQGFYYAFLSLLALQSFLELGLGRLITTFASHEWAHLSMEGPHIIGNLDALSRLSSLIRGAMRWYVPASLILPALLLLLGLGFWSNAQGAEVADWQLPWIFAALISGPRLLLVPLLSLLEGCGQLYEIYLFRLYEGIAYSLSVCALIVTTTSLWVLPLSSIISFILTALFITIKYRIFFLDLKKQPKTNANLIWTSDVWPQQWRTAIMWLSSFFSSYLIVPGTLHYFGPIRAGQIGMTKNIVDALLDISTKWMYTKTPKFGELIACRRLAELDNIFLRSLASAIFVLVFLLCILFVTLQVLQNYNIYFIDRLGTNEEVLLLSVGALFTLGIYSNNVYLMAHKKQPLALLFFVQGILMLFITFVLGRNEGWIVWGYALVASLFVYPLSTYILLKERLLSRVRLVEGENLPK